jgi:protein TonB
VGGDVKAPTVTRRVQPNYTEVARKSRVQGVVIVEAIIDKDGNVDHVKVLKGLPMGLSEEAESAVKKWKFRPGTLGGHPVDVIFNLTVNFTLDGGGPATREAPAVKIENPISTTETTSTQ